MLGVRQQDSNTVGMVVGDMDVSEDRLAKSEQAAALNSVGEERSGGRRNLPDEVIDHMEPCVSILTRTRTDRRQQMGWVVDRADKCCRSGLYWPSSLSLGSVSSGVGCWGV